MGTLEKLTPKRVFYYFEEISSIPRCSGDEKNISDYLKNIGENLGLETIQDNINNIIIRKPATPGYEDSEGVIIQGHMDMVCEKEENINHNFSKDPIELFIEGDYIKAKGTTLGADNGIAIAMGLAILEDNSLEHPNLELLVTVSEETEMDGALGLEEDILKGTRLLNVDSEEEGFLVVGSAGGELIEALLDTEVEKVSDHIGVSIVVKGLVGGHSGMEIDKERGNALKISLEILKILKQNLDIRLVSIDGGTKDNAIPRQAEIIVGIKKGQLEKLEIEIDKIEKRLEDELKQENIKIIVEKCSMLESALRKKDLESTIYLLDKLPTGVNTWIPEKQNIVESSSNLAIIKTEKDKIKIYISTRSSKEKILIEMREKIVEDIKKVGASVNISGNYPEWEYKPDSELRDKALDLYKKMFEKEMEATVIHAGLESGAFKKKYPKLDIISFGPNMYDVHTPQEKLSISSTERTYNYLVELLKKLK